MMYIMKKVSSILFIVFCFATPAISFGQAEWKERTYEHVLTSRDGHAGEFVWKMQRADKISGKSESVSSLQVSTADWLPAIVPGTVLNSLVYNNVYVESILGWLMLSIFKVFLPAFIVELN